MKDETRKARPALRWAVPVGAVAAVAVVGGFGGIMAAAADTTLPPRTAAQLLVDLQNAKLDPLSGTVVQRADLGLPSIAIPGGGGGQGSSDLSSLIAGSHTMKVWYGGPGKFRLALLGTLGESDVIGNGQDLWLWSSKENTATHHKISGDETTKPPLDASKLPRTPQEAADSLLATIDPTTVVSTAGNIRVAGRSAYDLILAPRDRESLVASVHLAIDGARHVPLRAQVFAKGNDTPVFEVGFTQLSFDAPDEANFRFTPPPGAKTEEAKPGADGLPAAPGKGQMDKGWMDKGAPRADGKPAPDGTTNAGGPVLIGQGWTTVVVTRAPQMPTPTTDDRRPDRGGNPAAILGSLPRVSGAWGSGHLLSSKIFSVLLTDDGRLLAGAVTPDRLYAAAADPAAKAIK